MKSEDRLRLLNYLDELYYDIGRQMTDFELQIQNQDGYMSKRYKYSYVGFQKKRFIVEANARTILKNEIVIDLDDGTKEEMYLKAGIVKKYFPSAKVYDSGSKGIHIHIFDRSMLHMTKQEREDYRMRHIKMFDADPQKAYERTTIALEYAPHWKTGVIKDESDNKIKEINT